MNCRDLQDLLVAYANGELHGTQKDFIEEHLNSCRQCREALYDYTMTREWLLTLRETPGLPEIKKETISEIRTIKLRSGFKRWLRVATISVPILLIVILATLLLTNVFDCTSGVITKAYAASSNLSSYRYEKDDYMQQSPDAEPVLSFHAEVEYSAPESYRFSSRKTDGEDFSSETIRIGDQAYTNAGLSLKLEKEWFEQVDPYEDKIIGLLNVLAATKTLDNEVIDGALCYHYVGKVDQEKYYEWSVPNYERLYYRMDRSLPYGMSTSLEAFLESFRGNYDNQDMTFEFWIGKKDYILRQAKLVYQTKEGTESTWNPYKSMSLLHYYDFNQEVIIEAPLDENGELSPGWTTYALEPLVIPEEEDVVISTRIPVKSRGLPSVIDKNLASAVMVKTYRSITRSWEYIGDTFELSRTSMHELGGKNLYHSSMVYTEEYISAYPAFDSPLEYTVIDDTVYSHNFDPPPTDFEGYDVSDLSGEKTIEALELLYNIETLDNEIINGTECYHFRGVLDVEAYLEWFYPEWKASFEKMNKASEFELDIDDGWNTIQEITRSKETIYEYWIGTEDYLIYKKIRTQRDLMEEPLALVDLSHRSTQQNITEYYDLDQPVGIEAPIDASGNLCEGWLETRLD